MSQNRKIWIGQLDIRYLAAKDKNAGRIQLAIAVLLQLLLQLKKICVAFKGTLWELLRCIRTTLVRESLYSSGPPDGCRWRSATADQSAAIPL
jgi:hypothetical protein